MSNAEVKYSIRVKNVFYLDLGRYMLSAASETKRQNS